MELNEVLEAETPTKELTNGLSEMKCDSVDGGVFTKDENGPGKTTSKDEILSQNGNDEQNSKHVQSVQNDDISLSEQGAHVSDITPPEGNTVKDTHVKNGEEKTVDVQKDTEDVYSDNESEKELQIDESLMLRENSLDEPGSEVQKDAKNLFDDERSGALTTKVADSEEGNHKTVDDDDDFIIKDTATVVTAVSNKVKVRQKG